MNAFIVMGTAALALLLVTGAAPADDRVPQPTALESFISNPAQRMQGLRLTMEDNAGSDSVHLDESQFAALKDSLASVERPMRIFCPGYRSGPDWTGLLLATYGGRALEFPDRRPVELTALIERASMTLAAR